MGVQIIIPSGKALPVEIVGSRKSDIIEYGVRWVVGQSSSVGERVKRVNGELFVGAATNLVAAIGIDNQIVENTFDNIDIFRTERVLIDGNYLVKRKLYFHKHEWKTEGGTSYEYHWMCEQKLPGYIRPRIFIDDAGEEIDFAYEGAFQASEDASGKARSIPNEFPKVNISRGNARKAARKNDGDGDNTDSAWGIKDLASYYYHIVVPFLVEFATRHSQSIMQGVVNMPYSNDHVALTTEEDSNIIVLSNTHGALFTIGQSIFIGTTRDSGMVVSERYIDDIQVDTPVAGQTTITFNGAPATITAGNVIASRGWRSGMTNGVKATSGALRANDGRNPIVFRGYENPFGNVYEFVDGGKIVDHQLWVTEDRTAYNDVASVGGVYAAPYSPVAYLNAQADDYVKELGYDAMFPYAQLPQVSGGGANNATYYADYYYQASGDRTLLVGGHWANGGYAGLFRWSANYSLDTSDINIGFRLSYRPLKGVN